MSEPTAGLKFTYIIPIYQRHDELRELLQTLTQQTDKDFEVIIVDDGSPDAVEPVTQEFAQQLTIECVRKRNSGPGQSRNHGMLKANGNYYIFLDSDTLLPNTYMAEVRRELEEDFVDFFGGSDASLDQFTDFQKAVNFSMTSMLTTGGVRGGKKKITRFQARSFNMGLSEEAFRQSGGFGKMRVGEDTDLSLRLWELGFKSRWFPNAYVYHKRRSDWRSFANQVRSFGRMRPILDMWHPQYAKLSFWLPTIFVGGLLIGLIALLRGFPWIILIYLFYFILVFIMASIQNNSIRIGLYSIATTFLQHWNYGVGFLETYIRIRIQKKNPKEVYPQYFF
ncbi:MAG: glycosyltransferase [Weeksellaceae bacterium]|nr:glycosyltransferase [Weeksellaceae bacterium]